jgi:hypothetical protein
MTSENNMDIIIKTATNKEVERVLINVSDENRFLEASLR